jgi:hypothetical protein
MLPESNLLPTCPSWPENPLAVAEKKSLVASDSDELGTIVSSCSFTISPEQRQFIIFCNLFLGFLTLLPILPLFSQKPLHHNTVTYIITVKPQS